MGQFHKIFVIAGLCLGVLAVNPGIAQACVSPTGVTGEVIYSSARDVFQGCTTNGWTAFHTQNRTPAATCLNPAATPGEIVYKSAYNAFMGCTLAGWQAFNAPLDPCAPANPEVGAGCLDGTIYVGKTPDGNVKMFTTASPGVGREWNTGNSSNYVDVGGLVNCTTGAQASCNTGRLNTPIIAAADSSTAGGVQPHNAALYCQNLVAHGYSDWYLPAYHELAMLYTARNSGVLAGSFPTVDSFPSSLYWSSSEYSGVGAMQINFATGGGYPFNAGANVDKRWPFTTRCVRNELSAVAVASGLVGYWKFDDGPGSTTAADLSGYGNTGTLQNINSTTGWVAGKQGYALEFNGTNSVVNAGSAAVLDNLAASSGCAWTYRTETGIPTQFPAILDKSSSGPGENGWNFYLSNHYMMYGGASTAWLGFYNNHAAYSERDHNNPHNGTWQHVCFTWDGNTSWTGTTLYMNGVPLTSDDTTGDYGGPFNDAANSLGIGGQAAGVSLDQWYKGRLDNVRLYNRALSAPEILEIYTSEGGTTPP